MTPKLQTDFAIDAANVPELTCGRQLSGSEGVTQRCLDVGASDALPLRLDAGQGGSGIGGFLKFRVGGRSGIIRWRNFFWGKKLLGVDKRAAEGGVVAGPRAIETGFALEMGAHGFHFGVEVIEIVQHQGFREHRQFGRAEVVLAVVTDDEVLDHRLEFVRESGLESELGLQHFQFNDHVAKKLTPGGIGERAVVGKFVNLADVVQKRSSKEEIAIDLGIVTAHQVAGTEQRDDVIEQTANVGVMQGLGRGSVAVGGRDFRIGHEGLDERLEMRIFERGDKSRQGLPEFVDILGGLGKIVREVDLAVTQLAQLVHSELKAVLVFVDEALDFEEVILLEGVENFFDVVPHFGFELAAAVAERERQIRFPSLLGLDLLSHDDESRGDDLVLLPRAITDIEVFHALW